MGCDGEGLLEFFYGPYGDDTGLAGVIFGAPGEYFDVGELKDTDQFAEESGFFMVGVDQGQAQTGVPDFYGEAWEAGPGAYVDQVLGGFVLSGREEMTGGEEGLAKMSCHDIFFLAHGREIDAGVPAEQEIDVGGYGSELIAGERGKQERLEKSGDAGGVHLWGL